MSDQPNDPAAARILICEDEALIAQDIAQCLTALDALKGIPYEIRTQYAGNP